MRTEKRSRFVPGLLLYLLVLVLLLSAALFILRDFLSCYEASRPVRALERYEAMLQEAPTEACRDGLAGLDTKLESEEEALAWLQPRLQDAQLREDLAESSEGRKLYRVLMDGQVCGSVTLVQQEAGRFGFAPWEIGEERYDFSPWLHTLSITVPAEYQVRLGTQTLGREYIVERALPFEALGECYELYDDLPTKTRYETGALLGEYALEAVDARQKPVAPEMLEDDRYLDNCSAEEKERLTAYAEAFVPAYVQYTSALVGLPTLSALIRNDSALYQRLRSVAADGFWRATYTNLLSTEVDRTVNLGNGRWMMDLHYETESESYSGLVALEYHLRFVLEESNGTLLAVALYNSY